MAHWLRRSKSAMCALGLCMLVSAGAYLPVIQGNYLYHDDYMLLFAHSDCREHPQYRIYTTSYGRPIGIRIKCFYAGLFETPAEANRARAMTLVAIGFLGFLLARRLAQAFGSWGEATLLASAVITLPPFQTPAAMIANSTHVYAGIVGFLAGELAVWAVYRDAAGTLDRVFAMIVCVVALSAGMLIYQPAVFYYVVPLALAIAFRKHSGALSVFVRATCAVIPLGVAAVGHLIWLKTIGAQRAEQVHDFLGKGRWFAGEVLPSVFSFWSLTPSAVGMFVFMVAGAGLVVALILRVHGADGASARGVLGAKAVVLVGLGVMSFLPNLVAAESILVIRLLIVVQALALVASYGVLRSWLGIGGAYRAGVVGVRRSILITVLAAAVAFGLYSAHNHVANLYATPGTLELSYIRERLRGQDLSKPRHIHIVRPRGSMLTGGGRVDEFGLMTTAFSQDSISIVKGALLELGLSSSHDTVTSGTTATHYDFPGPAASTADGMSPVPPDAIVIDMNDIGVRLTPS